MRRTTVALILVITQFVLLGLMVFIPHGELWDVPEPLFVFAVILCAIGLLSAILGGASLGPALTATPIPKDAAPLATRGVYGVVRHPIYTGLLAGSIGLVIIGASVWHLAAWAALVVLLSAKARWEERMLLQAHPEYAAYAAHVGRFVPGVGRIRP